MTMTLVQGTVLLKNGQKVVLFAPDMLNAMWKADSQYHGMATEMHFETVEMVERVEVSSTDGWCGMGEDHNGHVRQSEDQALAEASGR